MWNPITGFFPLEAFPTMLAVAIAFICVWVLGSMIKAAYFDD
jgi:hypothetical protein